MAAEFERAFGKVCEKFNIIELNQHQRKAITKTAKEKVDIFVNLPTGFGKSLIYQALPIIFDDISGNSGHIVIVVSPLVSLMNFQVAFLRSIGVPSVSLSDINEEEENDVKKGNFSIVYGTPESWIKNERWRKMLSNNTYSSKLSAIAVDEAHVIRQWGTSNNTSKAVFRECYSRLHELRSLAPSVQMLALTATATADTKKCIKDILMMVDPYVISESSNKTNITYSVVYMPKDTSLDKYFQWLSDELSDLGTNTPRTIIYCQTIKQCALIYATLKGMLGPRLFTGEEKNRRNITLEMLHSCTPAQNKEAILKAFQDKDFGIRVLVATIAFGMGIDCKGVCRTIHFGPSKNIEAYIQESGRAGRDNHQSVAFILYQGLLLSHVERNIKEYVKTNDCRRKNLMSHFDISEAESPEPMHLCCDNCALECECEASDCGKICSYPGTEEPEETTDSVCTPTREVKAEQKQAVSSSLTVYHKSLVNGLIRKSAYGQLKTSTNLQFILGFSELQIAQVLDNCHRIFSLEDVSNYVEIWDTKHAFKILTIMSETFHDMDLPESPNCQSEDSDGYDDTHDFDCNNAGDWNMLLDDDELFDIAADNLSLSLLDFSMNLSNDRSTDVVDIPRAAVGALEHLTL